MSHPSAKLSLNNSMHGSPFKQFLFTLAAVIVLGFILYSATRPINQQQKPSATPEPHAPAENLSAFMVVKCAHQPEKLRISLSKGTKENLLYEGTPDKLTIEETIDIPKKPTTTIIVEATWKQGTPDTPISISIEPDGYPARTSTNWSIDQTLHNTYTFSW